MLTPSVWNIVKEGKAFYFLILHTDYFFDAQNINSNNKVTDISYIYVSPWCSGYDYCTTLFNSGSAQVQIIPQINSSSFKIT